MDSDINKVTPLIPGTATAGEQKNQSGQDKSKSEKNQEHSETHEDTGALHAADQPVLETELSLAALGLLIQHKMEIMDQLRQKSDADNDEMEQDWGDDLALDNPPQGRAQNKNLAMTGDVAWPHDEAKLKAAGSPKTEQAIKAYEQGFEREKRLYPPPRSSQEFEDMPDEYKDILLKIDWLVQQGVDQIPFDWTRDPLQTLQEIFEAVRAEQLEKGTYTDYRAVAATGATDSSDED